MAHRGLFSRRVVEAPLAKNSKSRPAVAVAGTPLSHLPREQQPPAEPSQPKKQKWGTPEEQYVRLCNFAMLARYGYYCHATTIMSDTSYDQLEEAIFRIEDANRTIHYRWSPTGKPGSDDPSKYPSSVQMVWGGHADQPELWVIFERAALSAMKETLAAFNLSDLNDQKNLENDG